MVHAPHALRTTGEAAVAREHEPAGHASIPDDNGNPKATFWGEKAL